MILGIDEVGRGSWAGPLVMGAVILPNPHPDWVKFLTDSKKLTAKRRTELNQVILQNAAATGLGWVTPVEIDQIGLGEALKLAARRAVSKIRQKKVSFGEIIIDGPVNFLSGTPLENYVTNLNKADLLIKEVSAASIIAKVARDRYMQKIASNYPVYDFEHNVGYGTAKHRAAIDQFGPSEIHRFSIKPLQSYSASDYQNNSSGPSHDQLSAKNSTIKFTNMPKSSAFFAQNSKKNTTLVGQTAEKIVAIFLETQKNHQILSLNFKTKLFEVDIISKDTEKLYFTEVKYRKNSNSGIPFAAIDAKKLQKMRLAAETIFESSPNLKNLTPVLAVASVSGPDFHLDDWFELD